MALDSRASKKIDLRATTQINLEVLTIAAITFVYCN